MRKSPQVFVVVSDQIERDERGGGAGLDTARGETSLQGEEVQAGSTELLRAEPMSGAGGCVGARGCLGRRGQSYELCRVGSVRDVLPESL